MIEINGKKCDFSVHGIDYLITLNATNDLLSIELETKLDFH
jgi:hypothetical protein